MTIQKQAQPKYKSIKLGFGTGSLYDYGCTLFCIASVGEYDPAELNEILKKGGAFAGATKNLINWTKLESATRNHIKFHRRGYGYDDKEIKDAISKYGFCLIEVKLAPKHWVVAIGNQQILDPLTGKVEKSSKYEWTGYSIIEVQKEKKEEMTNEESASIVRNFYWDEGVKISKIDGVDVELKEQNDFAKLEPAVAKLSKKKEHYRNERDKARKQLKVCQESKSQSIEDLEVQHEAEIEDLSSSHSGEIAELARKLDIKTEGEPTMDSIYRSVKATIGDRDKKIDNLNQELEQSKAGVNWRRFTSRKFILALLGVLVPLANIALGWQLDIAEIMVAIAPLLAFIGAEGFTDYKERVLEAAK